MNEKISEIFNDNKETVFNVINNFNKETLSCQFTNKYLIYCLLKELSVKLHNFIV